MRIGIFGGSFSPVHYGHLLLAENCREQAGLDEVWFIPAKISPLKQNQPPIADHHRVAMLELAIAGNSAFFVSNIELERGGVSYTIDTLRSIRQQRPEAELFLLIGGDSLADLPRWKSPAEICESALPLLVSRLGIPPDDWSPLEGLVQPQRLQQIQSAVVSMPLVGLSSTEIRRRHAAGRSIRYQVPHAVEKYLQTHLASGEGKSL